MEQSTFSDCLERIGAEPEYILPMGRNKAKVSIKALDDNHKQGKLILVSAITPTPSGEGKTTISVGLAQGLQVLGKKVCLALRQPSMGPVFGRKGGATGGGKSTIIPTEEINMHFTGDFHAITSAHNLISAVIDNALFYRTINLDERKVTWKRVMDMNDRCLRSIIVGLNKQGFPRESSFDITPASEIMACLCLATSYADMRSRIDRIVIGFTVDDKPVFAKELGITGAVMALLKDAMMPNLVRSMEGVPCFLHGGPFANIAHGCNSVLATRMALRYGDYAVTEAGFAFDLGAEKFLDIKCRQTGLAPDAIVIVTTARALKMHGGTALADLKVPNVDAVRAGLPNLAAHLDAAANFQRPVVVAINKFADDNEEELLAIREFCKDRGVDCAVADIFANGGEGGRELAEKVIAAADRPSPNFKPLYEVNIPVEEKIRTIATKIYGADGVELTPAARKKLALFESCGLTNLPVCMAKTQNSLSDNAKLRGRPKGFTVTVRDFEIANGAGFLVALCGEIMRMPALPRIPNATSIELDDDGTIHGV
ncbi:formate--tetrahydrofolate ligase [Akkermansia sp. N21169]|jgi:formate--tetrahydrofolate ligase|uniref:formate--tetrahydrofolate ligase n=1 Tax=Akkermansia sp. N21169 TaxID=3040765 RepID=UPI00244E6FBF|nr:formate--tetrahydrofolate ligase [Akkermansia sp. N21169]MDH3068749.1 formate--tetrahydrofolate ligase [Akkermansia sp. N21169]